MLRAFSKRRDLKEGLTRVKSPAPNSAEEFPRILVPHTYRWLGAAMLLAVVLRITGIGFGLPLQLHPDESTQVQSAQHILAGDLNPRFFRYPTFFIYQMAVVDGLAQLSSSLVDGSVSSSTYFMLGRLLSALYGVLGVWSVFLLGRTVANERVGLFASFLLAVAPEHIRQSHFATVDIAMVSWATLAVALLLRAEKHGKASFIGAAIAIGLALSTKYSALLVITPMAALVTWYASRSQWDYRPWFTEHQITIGLITAGIVGLVAIAFLPVSIIVAVAQHWTSDGIVEPEYVNLLRTFLILGSVLSGAALLLGLGSSVFSDVKRICRVFAQPHLYIFVGLTLGAFLATSPFVILDLPHAARDIFYEYRHVLVGTAPQYAISDPMYRELLPQAIFPDPGYYWNWWMGQNGWIALGLTLCGAFYIAQRHRQAFFLTGVIIVLVFLTLTRAGNKADRYALPAVPLLVLWTSLGVEMIVSNALLSKRRIFQLLVVVAVFVVPLCSSSMILYRGFMLPDTRTLTFRWLEDHVAPGAIIVRESGMPDLEHANKSFHVISVASAFEKYSLNDWSEQGVNYLLVGQMCDWYKEYANVHARINENYSLLERTATLVKRFEASDSSQGGTVSIYRLR